MRLIEELVQAENVGAGDDLLLLPGRVSVKVHSATVRNASMRIRDLDGSLYDLRRSTKVIRLVQVK